MNDTEMTRKASEDDRKRSVFRAAQSESGEAAKNDNLHYTALELAEIKSEQVLATDANKAAETDTTAERTIVFCGNRDLLRVEK